MVRKELIAYLPDYLREFPSFQEIMRAGEESAIPMEAETERTLENQFVLFVDEAGVARFEQAYQIVRIPNSTLDERKFQILATINRQTPYTIRALEQMLETLCGPGGYECLLYSDIYTLHVKVGLTEKNKVTSIAELLANVVPCNLTWEVVLLYNTYQLIGQYTHAQLAAYTHEEIRSEVLPDA